MRVTGKEIIEYVESELKLRGATVGEMCRAINMNQARLSMWRQKDVSPTLQTLMAIIGYMNITLDQLIGLDKTENAIPEDIVGMERMLLHIPPEDREMIALNIKNYYERAMRKAEKKD